MTAAELVFCKLRWWQVDLQTGDVASTSSVTVRDAAATVAKGVGVWRQRGTEGVMFT